MDNVVSFNAKHKKENPARYLVIDFLEAIDKQEIIIPSTIRSALEQLALSPTMKPVADLWWKVTDLVLQSEVNVNTTYISFNTLLRQNLCTDFAMKIPVDFITIGYGYSSNPPKEEPLPKNLFEDIDSYIQSFVFDTDMDTSLTLFYISLIKYIRAQPHTNFVHIDYYSGVLQIAFAEQVDDKPIWLQYGLVLNMVPVLLDHCAFQMAQLSEDSAS